MVDENIHWGATDTDAVIALSLHQKPIVDQLLQNFNLELSIEESNERIKKGNYGLFSKIISEFFITRTETLDQYGLENLKTLTKCIGEQYAVYVLRKNSAFAQILNEKIQKYTEFGFIKHWFTQTWIRYGVKSVSNFYNTFSKVKFTEHKSLSLLHFKGVLVIWASAAMVVSPFIFICEIIWFKFKKATKK